mgnify:FL=1
MTEPIVPNMIVSVSGLGKSGKTYFSYTFPDPIRVYCFNNGADFIRTLFPKKQIDVQNFFLPIVEDTEMRWALPVWFKFREQYVSDIAGGKYRTYVFDTATEIENICQQAVLEEFQEAAEEKNKDKKRLATVEFLARNLRMKALFDRAANNGVNLVSIQYLKPEWVREKGKDKAEQTGRLILDGWQRTDTQADVNLWLEAKRKLVKGTTKTVTVATIKSTRFGRDQDEKEFDDTTYDEIVALLFGG